MRAEIMTGARFLAVCLTGFILVVFSTTLFAWFSVGPIRLSPLIVVAVSAGFRLPLLPGALAVAFLGYLADMVSGGVLGLQMMSYMVVLLLCAMADRQLEINSWAFQMISVGLMTLVQQAVVVGGLILMQRGHLAPANLPLILLFQALLNACTAPLFFTLLESAAAGINYFWPKDKKREV